MKRPALSITDRILLAASDLQQKKGAFSAEDLVVQAWRLFPNYFGLQGYAEEYPDSNRVLTKIMGIQSTIRKKGFLEKVGTKRYRLTEVGRLRAIELSASDDRSVRLSALSRNLVAVLRRMLTSRALVKFSQGEDLNFSDVCSFWNISPRSTAQQLSVRREEANKAIEVALKQSSHGLLILPGENWEISTEDIESLRKLSDFIEIKFRQDLSVIRSRLDERRL